LYLPSQFLLKVCAAICKGGLNKHGRGKEKSRAEDDAGFSEKFRSSGGSLAVFNVEQVALNRHKIIIKRTRVFYLTNG